MAGWVVGGVVGGGRRRFDGWILIRMGLFRLVSVSG